MTDISLDGLTDEVFCATFGMPVTWSDRNNAGWKRVRDHLERAFGNPGQTAITATTITELDQYLCANAPQYVKLSMQRYVDATKREAMGMGSASALMTRATIAARAVLAHDLRAWAMSLEEKL